MGDNKYKERHRKKGLCVDCQRPASNGNSRCKIHGKSHRKANKKDKENRLLNGKCIGCNRPLTELDTGFTNCCICRDGRFWGLTEWK